MESFLEIHLPISKKSYELLELLEKEQDSLPFCLNKENGTLVLHGYMKDNITKVQDDGFDDDKDGVDIDSFDNCDSIRNQFLM